MKDIEIFPIGLSLHSQSIGEEYAEKYCKEWYQNLSKDPDDFWYTHGEQHHIEPLYEASAINLFTCDPGWKEWNSLLHINKGEIPKEMWNNWVQGEIGLPSYLDPSFSFDNRVYYKVSFKLGDYKVLENALNRCKCGPITTYHGMEGQEIEKGAKTSTKISLQNLLKELKKKKRKAKDCKAMIN